MQVCRIDKNVVTVYLTLCLTYIVALFALNLNPAKIPAHMTLLGTQATNVGVMALFLWMARQSHTRCETFKSMHLSWTVCALLATSLAVRLGISAYGVPPPEKLTMWDTSVSVFGTLAVLSEMFFVVAHRSALNIATFVALLVFAVPLLTTIPKWVRDGVRPDPRTLATAATLCKAVYSGPTIENESTNTGVLVRHVGEVAYVTFRGTEDRTNWVTNINMRPTSAPWLPGGVRVHAGFLAAYHSVREGVKEATAGARTLVFCGHSLGGALATLAAMDALVGTRGIVVKVYTFGAPQVGDVAFASVFDDLVSECVRVVNPHDKVPDALGVGYVHTKGYYPVTTLTKDIFPVSHAMNTYTLALSRNRVLRTLGIFAPTAYVAISAGALWLFHAYVRNHFGR